jgi:hypothetical protein
VYFTVFEAFWNGQTPGKRLGKLRVVTIDGQPIGMRESVIRNLVRTVDFLPTMYLVGLISILSSKRNQRIGDLAAATMVVQERNVEPPAPLVLPPGPPGLVSIDATALGPQDYELIRAFLLRRYSLPDTARAALAEQVRAAVQPRVPGAAAFQGSTETLLEELARSYHERQSAR